MEVVHGRGYVDSIQYHIVWYVKYRYKLISSGMESSVTEIVNKIVENNGF